MNHETLKRKHLYSVIQIILKQNEKIKIKKYDFNEF